MSSNTAVSLVIVTPDGKIFPQSSLENCGAFIRDLTYRVTGKSKFVDYRTIRHIIDHSDGIIAVAGFMANWKIIEFTDGNKKVREKKQRQFIFDYYGFPKFDLESQGVIEIKKEGAREIERHRDIEVKREPSDDGQSNTEMTVSLTVNNELKPNITAVEINDNYSVYNNLNTESGRTAEYSIENFNKVFGKD